MNKHLVSTTAAALGVAATLMVAAPALAATAENNRPPIHRPVGKALGQFAKAHKSKSAPHQNMVVGSVTAVAGAVINVTAKGGGDYAINAAHAKIMKAGAVVDVSAIQVGDLLMARGTLSGLSLTATTIVDGVTPRPVLGANGIKNVPGQLHAAGLIASIDGLNLKLTVHGRGQSAAASETIVTDGSTVVTKDRQPAAFSDLAAGERVLVTATKDATTGELIASKIDISTHAPNRTPQNHK